MALSRRSLLAGLLAPVALPMLATCTQREPPIRIAIERPPRHPWPTLRLPREPIPQGGTFVAAVEGAGITAATIEFGGRHVPMVEEHGTLLAVLPVGQLVGSTAQVPPGAYPVALHYDVAGQRLPRTLEGGVTVTPSAFPVDELRFAPETAALLDPARMAEETAILQRAYGSFAPARRWEGFFVRPCGAAVSDVYGARRSYQGGPLSGSHAGVDFGAFSGAPVVAAANGRVVLAQSLPIRGTTVILDHGLGVFTGYCHLSTARVAPHQEVRAGEPIAAVGATGLVTGPHLHWEVIVGGAHVDGLRWLPS